MRHDTHTLSTSCLWCSLHKDKLSPLITLEEHNSCWIKKLCLVSEVSVCPSLSLRIYECNKRCKCCSQMCTNRLVQHGLQVRLQLFKTQNKGWGIRCLDDVAKGSFVCIYAGEEREETYQTGLCAQRGWKTDMPSDIFSFSFMTRQMTVSSPPSLYKVKSWLTTLLIKKVLKWATSILPT